MNEHKTIIRWFCGCFITTFIILVGYLCYSMTTFRNSQERIVTEHLRHLANVDSVFYDIKRVILSNDSGTIVNAPILLSQLQNDSALLRREILLSQAEESNLIALHIDKIDNDYAQIGIWGGILSIIFLIFGFFAIFKIEETKADAKNTLEEVKTQGRKASDEIKAEAKDTLEYVKDQKNKATAEIKELQGQAAELNNLFDSNNKKVKDLDGFITSLNTKNSQAEEYLGRINELLVEVESKNKQYDLANKQMIDLMGQLSQLIDSLNAATNNGDDSEHE